MEESIIDPSFEIGYGDLSEEEITCLEKSLTPREYDLLDKKGLFSKGAKLTKRHAIVFCHDKNKGKNRSVFCDEEDELVDDVIDCVNYAGKRLVKVVTQRSMQPRHGDKFTSRSAQKGTCGMFFEDCEMFWDKNGVARDVMINPHAIPSRMTLHHLVETIVGKTYLESPSESTTAPTISEPFATSNDAFVEVEKMLRRKGFDGDKTVLYNGATGRKLRVKILMEPTYMYYQRLKHFVDGKIHVRTIGHVATLTRQPIEGRSRNGGLCFGEMEKDCATGLATSGFLRERFLSSSDPYSILICRECKNQTVLFDKCDFCGAGAESIATVEIPYSSKLMLQYLGGMVIKMRFDV